VTPTYTWEITKPEGATLGGAGSTALVLADKPGTYSCTFTASAGRGCPPPDIQVGPQTATCAGEKVSLGGTLSSTQDPGCFNVYVPTKWGGKLNVATTSGTIENLSYPGGDSYTNNTETGEDQHGWYTFKVTGSTAYTVSATFIQEGQAATRPWNFYWWASKGDYIYDGGNGIADTTALGDDVQVVALGAPAPDGADVIRSGPNGTLETPASGDDIMEAMVNLFDDTGSYQPLVKYDARHGTTTRDWELANGQGTEDWHGHCLGATIASIKLNQPTPAAGTGYNRDELEGLWGELGENDDHQYLQEVGPIPPGPPIPGADNTDDKAPRFHGILEEFVKSRNEVLYIEARADSLVDDWGGTREGEVWNHAAYKFSAAIQETAEGNEKVVHIATTVFLNDDYEPPTDDINDRVPEYEYIITYQVNGTPDSNASATMDWISATGDAAFAPKWLSQVGTAVWSGDNPDVTHINVANADSAN
jgi:hypothetical protein